MNKIGQFKSWADAHRDLFLDLARIYVGTGLFVKGVYLMNHREFLVDTIQQAGNLLLGPMAIAHYVIPAHLVGGILLALGLLTRVAALAQIPILCGAVFYVYLPKINIFEPRQNLEFSALVLVLLALIFVFGAGRCSVDSYLARKSPDLSHSPPETLSSPSAS